MQEIWLASVQFSLQRDENVIVIVDCSFERLTAQQKKECIIISVVRLLSGRGVIGATQIGEEVVTSTCWLVQVSDYRRRPMSPFIEGLFR